MSGYDAVWHWAAGSTRLHLVITAHLDPPCPQGHDWRIANHKGRTRAACGIRPDVRHLRWPSATGPLPPVCSSCWAIYTRAQNLPMRWDWTTNRPTGDPRDAR